MLCAGRWNLLLTFWQWYIRVHGTSNTTRWWDGVQVWGRLSSARHPRPLKCSVCAPTIDLLSYKKNYLVSRGSETLVLEGHMRLSSANWQLNQVNDHTCGNANTTLRGVSALHTESRGVCCFVVNNVERKALCNFHDDLDTATMIYYGIHNTYRICCTTIPNTLAFPRVTLAYVIIII